MCDLIWVRVCLICSSNMLLTTIFTQNLLFCILFSVILFFKAIILFNAIFGKNLVKKHKDEIKLKPTVVIFTVSEVNALL